MVSLDSLKSDRSLTFEVAVQYRVILHGDMSRVYIIANSSMTEFMYCALSKMGYSAMHD